MEEVLKRLFDAVLEGDFDSVKTNIQAALDANLDPNVILNEGMIAARAMQTGMAILKSYVQKTARKSSCKVVIGTVKGDLHDIVSVTVVKVSRSSE